MTLFRRGANDRESNGLGHRGSAALSVGRTLDSAIHGGTEGYGGVVTGSALEGEDELVDLDPTYESSSMERLLELALMAELTQEAWFGRSQLIDVLHSTVDAFGHDVVLECRHVLRHVQIKSRKLTGKRSRYTISTKLAERPSGCVVWVGWSLEPATHRVRMKYRWFGGAPGEPLPDLGSQVGKHTKGNAEGVKLERPNTRVLNLGAFKKLDGVPELLDCLFGPS